MLRAAFIATILVVATVGAPVAAQSEQKTFVDAMIDEEDDDILAVAGRSFAREVGSWAKTWAKAAAAFDEPEGNASTYATDLRQEFNDDSAAIESQVNDEVSADTSRDTFRVCTHDRDGGAAEVYLVANVTNGSYADTRMVTPSTFDSLNRSVDYNVSLDWYASKNAAGELDSFVDEHASTDEPVPASYQVRMAAQYGDSVQSGLWGAAPEDCPA